MKFSKKEHLEFWLQDKPSDWGRAIGVRAALRTLPILGFALGPRGGGVDKVGRSVLLPAFYAFSAAWVAAAANDTFAFSPAGEAARLAANAAEKVSKRTPAVSSALFASCFAAYAIDEESSASLAADSANDAFRSADSAIRIWDAVSADATALAEKPGFNERPGTLVFQALWPTGVPNWILQHWSRLEGALVDAGNDWHVWADWYDARLYGIPYSGIVPDMSVEGDRLRVFEEYWSKGPALVNAHIRRLIERSEDSSDRKIFESAFEDAKLLEPAKIPPPVVPAPRRAAVEPTWKNGRLTVPKKPAKVDLSKKKFSAALSALRSELRELVEDVNAEANIDKRPARYLARLAGRIPEATPSHDELFRIGHVETVLVGFAKTVTEEWPDFLAARYQAILLQFDRTMRQSPVWREFRQNAAKETLSAEQIASAPSLAREAVAALQEAEALEFVDPAIPNALERLLDVLSAAATENEAAAKEIDASSELLAADLIESVNNILKPIAEVALDAARDYGKGLGDGLKKEAKKQGPKDGQKVFKWLRRLVIGGAGVGIGHFAGLSSLIGNYPQAFDWLSSVLKHLPLP